MSTVIILLRIIHIFCGVFWVGFAITNFFYLQPAITATGKDGQSVMKYLGQQTKLFPTIYAAATLTMISGIGLFFPIMSLMSSPYGKVISYGALAGIIAWFLAIFIIRKIINQTQKLGMEISTQDAPPSEDQLGQMTVLGNKMDRYGKLTIAFMVIALAGMSAAQYI